MKTYIHIILLFFLSLPVLGQNSMEFLVKDAESQEPLIGANVVLKGTTNGSSADINGLALVKNIPDGEQSFEISFVGYEPQTIALRFPREGKAPMTITLHHDEEHEMEAITVSATRSSRTIDDIPTRVEAIAGEELSEKSNMNSSNISMLLRESTGIQVQQTSAASANAVFRIQGLDGRYTQMLRDGLPIYAGYSGGLSVMQIPPLDLKQVEIIKGSSSTLYGGGAIAGLINLVPKKPEDKPELSIMLNATSAGGADVNAFYAEKYGRTGLSVYGTANYQDAYDPDENNFTDIPFIQRFNLNPTFFVYGDQSELELGVLASTEKRRGGDLRAFDNKEGYTYREINSSDRLTGFGQFAYHFSDKQQLQVKSSLSYFKRGISLSDYQFDGQQIAGFAEVNYSHKGEKSEWMGGLNLWTEDFKQLEGSGNNELLDYSLLTTGAFLQNVWTPAGWFALETGVRADYQNETGFFVLPRVSALFRLSEKLSSRIGGGMGYKAPTVFVEASEKVSFRNVLPLNYNRASAETSKGLNWDVNYKTAMGEHWTFSINQLFFYTRIDEPVVPVRTTDGLAFENVNGYVHTKGFESNIKLTYRDFKLFTGYTFVQANRNYEQTQSLMPLTPKHQMGMMLVYEKHGKGRIGYELYYTGKQMLDNSTQTPDAWRMGLMAERHWGRFSVFANLENFTDTRQSRFEPIVRGDDPNQPDFAQIWAPTDGFVANGGVKIRLK